MLINEKQLEVINKIIQTEVVVGGRVEDIDICAKPDGSVHVQYRVFESPTGNDYEFREFRINSKGVVTIRK